MIMKPLDNPFRGPLTAVDIAVIKGRMNILIYALSSNDENRQHALAMELPDQIEQSIRVTQSAAEGSYLEGGPELAVILRNLLRIVNRYYHQLN